LGAFFPAAFVAPEPMSVALRVFSAWSSSHWNSGPLFGPELVGCHHVRGLPAVREGAADAPEHAMASSRLIPEATMAALFTAGRYPFGSGTGPDGPAGATRSAAAVTFVISVVPAIRREPTAPGWPAAVSVPALSRSASADL
jgi:hypothetical protein